GEIAARGGADSVLFGVRLEGEFGHEFGPPVGIVGVVGPVGEVLGKVDLLVNVGLQEVRIDTAGGGEDDFPDLGAQGFGEDQTVEEEIGGRAGLVEIDVASAAVIGGEMEHGVDAVHGGARDPRFAKVGLEEIGAAVAEQASDVVQVAAGEVVDDAHGGTAIEE